MMVILDWGSWLMNNADCEDRIGGMLRRQLYIHMIELLYKLLTRI